MGEDYITMIRNTRRLSSYYFRRGVWHLARRESAKTEEAKREIETQWTKEQEANKPYLEKMRKLGVIIYPAIEGIVELN